MSWFPAIRDPVTRKRWQRFRANRRAWWSVWILATLYGLSLVSELICNDRPVYLRFQGRSFFPVFRYYAEDIFTGSGRQTRPDYKKLRASEAFRASPGALMVFPPVPYGPYEIIDPASVAGEEKATVRLAPAPRVAAINLTAALVVDRAQAAGPFFGTDDDAVNGRRLDEEWTVDAVLQEAIAARFANRAAPAVTGTLTGQRDPAARADFALLAYTPRAAPPATVRLSLSEPDEVVAAQRRELTFNRRLQPTGDVPELWASADDATRETLRAAAGAAFEGTATSAEIRIGESYYRLTTTRNDVAWPFPPCAGHWMGIDSAGRDVLARIVYGLRISMTFGFLLVLVSMAVGVTVGAVQGYYGGGVDITGQRLIEIWSALPFLYVMMLLGSVYGQSFLLLLVCYGIFNWIGISYYIRAEFLRLRHQPFVDAARCLGASGPAIIFRHIMPNALTPVVTFFPFSLVGAIESLAALDYLGFGLPPPTASWGQLLLQAQQYRWAWWLILYPFLALFMVILLGIFIGEGVRDAYDPRPYSRLK